jgi:hypothetical protein
VIQAFSQSAVASAITWAILQKNQLQFIKESNPTYRFWKRRGAAEAAVMAKEAAKRVMIWTIMKEWVMKGRVDSKYGS